MVDGVRIDELTPATSPDPAHIVPVMKDGASESLTAEQIASLIATGAPAALNTLQKLAQAVNNDATFYQSVADAIAASGAQAEASEVLAGIIEIATAAEIRAMASNVLALTPGRVKDAMAEVTLTDAATVAWDMSAGVDFVLTATSGVGNTRVLGNPSNPVVGRRGRIRYVQDSTGGRSISKSSYMKTPGGVALQMPLTSNAEGYIFYDCISSTKILLSFSSLAWS